MSREDLAIDILKNMTPEESLSTLKMPWEQTYKNKLKELVNEGNKIVGYTRSNIGLCTYPPQHFAIIEYLTQKGELKSTGVSHIDRIEENTTHLA